MFEKLITNNFEPIKGLMGDEISYATPIIGLVSITGSMWYAVIIVNTNIIDSETYKNATKPRINAYFEGLLSDYGRKNIAVLNLFVSEKASDYTVFLSEDNFEFDRDVMNIYWEMRLYDEVLTIGKNHPDKIANLRVLVMDSLNFSLVNEEAVIYENTTEEIYQRALKQRPRLEVKGGQAPIFTYILIIINMMIHASIAFSGVQGFNIAMGAGALIPRLVTEGGQYYRLFTSMFLHVNFMHLINNCFSLYIFGSRAEQFYGGFKFWVIYMLSGVFGGIVSVLFVPNPTIGASGAVFGLLGAVLALTVKSKMDAGGLNYPIMLILAGTSLGLGFMRPEINNHAHIGGLIAGFVLGFLLYRSKRYDS
ncbi:MAG: rhomboid family intramembrane serine protease [Defluviitaleaceae bacterium]|nr:rhomboid family intramembrane serine protease [Defluviitaleaceae bacterium]